MDVFVKSSQTSSFIQCILITFNSYIIHNIPSSSHWWNRPDGLSGWNASWRRAFQESYLTSMTFMKPVSEANNHQISICHLEKLSINSVPTPKTTQRNCAAAAFAFWSALVYAQNARHWRELATRNIENSGDIIGLACGGFRHIIKMPSIAILAAAGIVCGNIVFALARIDIKSAHSLIGAKWRRCASLVAAAFIRLRTSYCGIFNSIIKINSKIRKYLISTAARASLQAI